MEGDSEKYKILVAPAANDRMADHFAFLAEVNERAAERLLDTLLLDIRSLEERPFRNSPYERPFTPAGKYRYLLSAKRYRIVYRVRDGTVFVDDIQDCRQDDDKSMLGE